MSEPVPLMPGDLTPPALVSVLEIFEGMRDRLRKDAVHRPTVEVFYLLSFYESACIAHRAVLDGMLESLVEDDDD